MKTQLLLTIALLLGISYQQWGQTYTASANLKDPYVEVVITDQHIWLMPDETPVSELPVQVVDASGEVVLQKVFCTKTAEWLLDVSNLPSGKYKVLIGSTQTEYLEKKGRRWTL